MRGGELTIDSDIVRNGTSDYNTPRLSKLKPEIIQIDSSDSESDSVRIRYSKPIRVRSKRPKPEIVQLDSSDSESDSAAIAITATRVPSAEDSIEHSESESDNVGTKNHHSDGIRTTIYDSDSSDGIDVAVGIGTADLLDLDAAHQLVDDLTWKLLTIDAPDWYINPTFKAVFPERSAYDSIAACSPLTLCPGLYDVLRSSEPPSIEFFKSLPEIDGKMWAIYCVTLEKPGYKSKLYIGSGTEAEYGVILRFRTYKPDNHLLPILVRKAFHLGFQMTHFGLLCWTPLPSPGLVPRVRARFLSLEAIFTCLFLALRKAKSDVYYDAVLLWERDTVEREPLCTHLPLNEKIIGNLDLSTEELEIIDALRRAKKQKRSRDWRVTERERDIDAFREQDRIKKNDWASKNRDKVNKTAAKVRSKALEQQRFHCDDCDIPLQSRHALDAHEATQSHADRVNGIEKPEITQYSLNRKAVRAAAKASNLHRCHTCDKKFDTNWALNRHNATPSHLRRAEAQASQ